MGQATRSAPQGAGLAARSRVEASPEIVDLGDAGRLATLLDDWRALALELGGTSFFQTPDWILSWWATLGGRAPGSVAAWRGPSGRLEALVALSRSSERLHRRAPLAVPVYANVGSGPGAADHCGWLVRPERARQVAAWVSEAIGSSALLVRSAAADWPGARVLPAGARVVETTPCPSVELPLAAEHGAPSATFIRQLRRFTRRLERDGVTFEAVTPKQVDDRVLTALFALHAGGRAGTGFGVEQLALHRLLVERAGPYRGPAAVVALRDEAIVGVLYGFWWDDTFAAYQSGWDRRYAHDSLGNVLILQGLELAAARGARSFDFLRGVEPYKYRFGAHDRWDRTWLVPRGPAGALLVARHRARRRRRPAAARTAEQLRRHYEVERRLGDRLRRASREERTRLYSEVYDELFRSVPDHPQLRWRADPRLRAARVERHLQTIARFLPRGGTYLEVGAGDCALAARMTSRAGKVYAIDVSEEIAAPAGRPASVEVVITDGRSIPVAPGSAHVAFSDQLMEHLHPEDAAEQLANIHRALAPGGAYLCITPNRLSGPHDISRRFDAVATGLHLKEYTSGELAILMRRAGFTEVRTFLTVGGRTVTAPVAVAQAIETLARATGAVGRRLAHERLGARALGNRIVAIK